MESFIVNRHSLPNITNNNITNNNNNLITSNNSIQVIVDGCHNGASVEYFMTDLRTLYPESNYELWVIVGMGKDKNINVMIEFIQQIADKIILSKSRHFRAMSKKSLFFLKLNSFIHILFFICFV